MVFGFLKKNSNKNEFEGSNEDFWTSCITLVMYSMDTQTEHYAISAPFVDIKNNMKNESFLKKVIENDKDVHRKTAALFYLFQFFGNDSTLNEFFNNICDESNLSLDEIKEFTDDVNAVVNVMNNNNLLKYVS